VNETHALAVNDAHARPGLYLNKFLKQHECCYINQRNFRREISEVHIFLGKELRLEYAQSNTTILTSIINIMRVPTTIHVSALHVGHHQVVKFRPEKLHHVAWEH